MGARHDGSVACARRNTLRGVAACLANFAPCSSAAGLDKRHAIPHGWAREYRDLCRQSERFGAQDPRRESRAASNLELGNFVWRTCGIAQIGAIEILADEQGGRGSGARATRTAPASVSDSLSLFSQAIRL